MHLLNTGFLGQYVCFLFTSTLGVCSTFRTSTEVTTWIWINKTFMKQKFHLLFMDCLVHLWVSWMFCLQYLTCKEEFMIPYSFRNFIELIKQNLLLKQIQTFQLLWRWWFMNIWAKSMRLFFLWTKKNPQYLSFNENIA